MYPTSPKQRGNNMREVIHFDSQEARLAFLKGDYEEIVCEKVEEKPKKAAKKKAKKEVKDEVPAE